MIRKSEIKTSSIIFIGIIIALGISNFEPPFHFIAPAYEFLFHLMLEIIGISLAIAISIQSWLVFPHTLSKQRLIIGALFLTVGLFDIFHVLTYEGMPFYVGYSIQDENWFWLFSRFSLALGSFVMFIQKDKEIEKKYRTYVLLGVSFYVAIVGFIIFRQANVLPPLVTEEIGSTAIRNQLEMIIIAIFITTISLLIYFYKKTSNEFYLVLIVAFSFSALCELTLMLNTSHNVFQSIFGHLFKVASYYFFMKGIYVVTIEEPFAKQKEAQIALQESEIRLEEIVKKVNYLAYHDELTGLPNRNYLLTSLEEQIKKIENNDGVFALISINLNRFKNVNDTLGTEMGDLFLKTIAERLKEFKNEDSILARMVADEFMFIFPNEHHIDELIHRANMIHKRIEEPMIAKGFKFHITSSIGITLFNENIESVGQLIKQAQLSMHEAKKNGQSVMVYHPEMNIGLFENILLENDLRQALDRNEFVLYYQPQVNIETGDIIGVEALIRWDHHEKGMISPGKFIPLAEETGLIIPIGNWVIEEACKQLKRWHDKGITSLRLSINLSLRQIFQEDLVEIIANALEKSKINPKYIELEITESMAVNTDRVITILKSLKELGVRIAVDDFGTGYSSLSYLYSFPIDQLKIDQSFISNLFIEENNKVIVSTIISMGQNLGLELIAEGVETKEQIDFLKSYKCVGIQGFLISRPLPAESIESLLSEKTIMLEKYTG